MTNQVTYAIDLTPENAEKIDQVNRILLGDSYTAETPKQPAKQGKSTTAVDDQNAPDPETNKAASSLTLDQVKRAAKKAKSTHDEAFANSVLDSFGVKAGASLGRRMSAIDESDYQAIVDAWVAGPQTEATSDELEDDLDDGLGDDDLDDGLGDDESEVTAEAVKTALKAYAKEVGRDEAKEIMTKNGAAALSKVDDCTPDQLKAMFAALV